MAGREDGGGSATRETMEEGRQHGEQSRYQSSEDGGAGSERYSGGNDMISVQFMQKIVAEVLGTYFMIFAGCGSVVVNLSTEGTVTFPGICAVWGLVVMVLVYSVGHVSGAHLNPAVTVAFAACGRFPWKQVPSYAVAQVLGSTLASLTLRVVFGGAAAHEHFFGTAPAGSDAQALVLEFVISFYLMFVVSGVATDNRAVTADNDMFHLIISVAGCQASSFDRDDDALEIVLAQIGELAGLAVGATVLLNVLFAGPITGASMNPARTLGPAIVAGRYRSIWVYMVGPVCGTVAGSWAYNLVRFTDKPLREITKSGSFLRSARISS